VKEQSWLKPRGRRTVSGCRPLSMTMTMTSPLWLRTADAEEAGRFLREKQDLVAG
jgi:hypothetical protein